MWSVPVLYSEGAFATRMRLDERLVQRSTESRTTEAGIGDVGRVLENLQSKVAEEEMA
jgi:hypothetical protein